MQSCILPPTCAHSTTGQRSSPAGLGAGRYRAAFAREGASVVISDINEAAGHETAQVITDAGGRATSKGPM